jgi:hypothetical protein
MWFPIKGSRLTKLSALKLKVRKAILLLEDCTRLVSILDLFSKNETVSEVPTSSLKFFLLPVLLGDLQMKTTDSTTRLELVKNPFFHMPYLLNLFIFFTFQIKVVETYYIDFLQRVRDYEIVKNITIPKTTEEEEGPRNGPPDLSSRMQVSNSLRPFEKSWLKVNVIVTLEFLSFFQFACIF